MSDAIWPDDPHGDCGEVRVVAVAPQTASAAKLKKAYDGRVATQGVDGQTPTIQLKVQFRRKDGKLVPYYLANLKHPRDSPRAEGIADLLQLTIRLVTTDPTQGRCDSGTVSYTAPRGGQLQSSPVGVEAKRTSGAELCSIGGTITGAVLLAYSRRRSDSTPADPRSLSSNSRMRSVLSRIARARSLRNPVPPPVL